MKSHGFRGEWVIWKWRLLFLVRSPHLVLRRMWFGKDFFTQVPWTEIAEILRDDGIVIEAGAADGTDTRELAKLVPKGTVYAFEPFPPMFARLKSNTHGVGNVRCEPLALSTQAGQAQFFASYVAGMIQESGSILRPDQHVQLHPEISFDDSGVVDCVNLDQYFLQRDLIMPEFAWLDLQGMEIAVLESSPLVRRSLKGLWMEVSRAPLYCKAPTYRQVLRTMKRWGFRAHVNRVGASAGNILFVQSAAANHN